jgi:quercetin dioxygenase-like cupin family protein
MEYFAHVPGKIDVQPLVAQIDAHPQLWNQNPQRRDQEKSPHARMSDIWVRYNSPDRFKDLRTFGDEHVPVWYPAYYQLPAIKPIVHKLMSVFEGEMLGGVLITRIPPGAGIGKHSDRGWHVEYYDKFYVSLRSAPGANFYCEDEMINPEPGDVYWFDNRAEHWVENDSDEDRMTLIVCIHTAFFKGVS